MVKIYIILGSTRPNRMSEKLAPWVLEVAKKHTEAEFELIDLRDWPLPFYQEVASVDDLTEYSVPLAKKWSEKIKEGDGFVIVTPEYNHGYTAVLKNALDYLYFEWHRKPVGFVSYGGPVGGSRAVEQLRLVSLELKMVPVSTGVHIARVESALDQNNVPTDPRYGKTLEKLLKDLIWYAKTLKPAREKA